MLWWLLWGAPALATEWCNGVDDDADGLVDEGPAVVWPDVDGDGAGDEVAPLFVVTCEPVPNHVQTGDDCDDGDAAVLEGVAEVCNAVDDDCDGEIDEEGICSCSARWRDESTYQFCTADRDWDEARDACDQGGYHLVTIDGAGENDFVENNLGGTFDSYWWIGLHDPNSDDAWVWEDGSPGAYLNWATQQPNGRGDDCVFMGDFDGAWYDWDCGSGSPFVCEVECTTAWFDDEDGDGFGAGDPTVACKGPRDHVLNGVDCDDADPAVAASMTWFPDVDGDGFGDSAAGFDACAEPIDAVLVGGDCDDTDPAVLDGCGEPTGTGTGTPTGDASVDPIAELIDIRGGGCSCRSTGSGTSGALLALLLICRRREARMKQ